MNTSEFAESYRIQTYAEYVRAKQRDQNPSRRSRVEGGWSETPYCTAAAMTTAAAYNYTHRCVSIFVSVGLVSCSVFEILF